MLRFVVCLACFVSHVASDVFLYFPGMSGYTIIPTVHLQGPYAMHTISGYPCNETSTQECIAIDESNPHAIAILLTGPHNTTAFDNIPTLSVPKYSLQNVTGTTEIYIEEPEYYFIIFMFVCFVTLGISLFCTRAELVRIMNKVHLPLNGSVMTFGEYSRKENLLYSDSCTICLEQYETNNKVLVLNNCSHAFHQKCISSWVASHRSDAACPNCRVVM